MLRLVTELDEEQPVSSEVPAVFVEAVEWPEDCLVAVEVSAATFAAAGEEELSVAGEQLAVLG